ncbi:MAG TPA: pyridoxal-dependent decarboxylase [Egibacteraceae bacterium]|nr:pyridoxal-dependent decarboxylase [Egibacteraceae bacterium]
MHHDDDRLLREAAELAIEWRRSLPKRHVGATADLGELREALIRPLPADGEPDEQIVRRLARDAEAGTVAMGGPRYFGFVIGGAHPAALAADWLTSAWDQNAGLIAGGPAAAVVEEAVGGWLAQLLGLPTSASFALVTGCQMAHFTALAAARHRVLQQAGWDVEERGMFGAPPVTVLVGQERHVTVDRALRYLGFGRSSVVAVEADDQGAMNMAALAAAVEGCTGPVIVCTQAGNVNTGACDDLRAAADIAHDADAWLHVDGAFGLWAAASPRFRHLVDGLERADSWATDGHKWLNVPYDSGIAFVAHPASHRAAMAVTAAYLVQRHNGDRDEVDWTPEFSRRARAFPLYAVLQALGNKGVEALVDRCCDHAARFAQRLAQARDVEVLNDVVLNQVLVRFGNDDAITRAVVEGVQREGTCWLSGTTWRGSAAMRISVVNWSTTTEDVDRSVEAILRVAGNVLADLP